MSIFILQTHRTTLVEFAIAKIHVYRLALLKGLGEVTDGRALVRC